MVDQSTPSGVSRQVPSLIRKAHRTLEPYHALVYLAPEAEQEYVHLGLEAGRMTYFAPRAAPMGAVVSEVVVATFYSFQPDLVRRSLVGAWDRSSTPEEVLAARLRVIDGALRRVLGDAVESDEMVEAANVAARAAAACTSEGRALYAGHASLAWPELPHLRLWHALSLIREFRGDGHIAAMVVAEMSGVEAMLTHHATGEIPDVYLASRSWTDSQLERGREKLRTRGWFDDANALTEEGRTARQAIEDQTDTLSAAPWSAIGDEDTERLRTLVRPWSKAITADAFGAFR